MVQLFQGTTERRQHTQRQVSVFQTLFFPPKKSPPMSGRHQQVVLVKHFFFLFVYLNQGTADTHSDSRLEHKDLKARFVGGGGRGNSCHSSVVNSFSLFRPSQRNPQQHPPEIRVAHRKRQPLPKRSPERTRHARKISD